MAEPMMIDSLWHLRGSVPLDGVTGGEATLDGLERLLEKQRKPTTERTSDCIAFDDPLWRDPYGPNWLAMILYDHGRFWIEQGAGERRLRYDLRSLHGMIFCLIGSVMFFGVGCASGGIGMFALLYGMNILMARIRIPRLIRMAVRDK